MLAGRLHDDATAHDVSGELVQARRFLLDERGERLGMIHVAEGNPQGKLHGVTSP